MTEYKKGDRVEVFVPRPPRITGACEVWQPATYVSSDGYERHTVEIDGRRHSCGDEGIRPVRAPAPQVPIFMSTDSAERKLMPVAEGVMRYFPDALLVVSFVSRNGNEKHNPGEALRWAKEKSADEKDAEARHMLDHFRGLPPDPGLERLGKLGHLASKAWRALADLQRACDEERAAFEASADEADDGRYRFPLAP